MRKSEQKHPYSLGYAFWAPILSEWIASDRYSEASKEYFRECLEAMLEDRNLMNIVER